jgi:cytochrome c-type biogenesis protein
METLFDTLTRAIEGSIWIASASALLWGVLSVLLSPCHLASIPLIVAFVGESGADSARRAGLIATLFSLGILLTIGALGAMTAALGRMLGDVGPYAHYGIALVFFLIGLHFLGVIPLPGFGRGAPGGARRGPGAAFLLGLLFGIGVGPCTFAYLAPMLAITFRVAAERMLYGAFLLLLYGLGHCAVIVAAGTSTEWVQRLLNWNARSRGAVRLRRACGLLILLGGGYLIYTAP